MVAVLMGTTGAVPAARAASARRRRILVESMVVGFRVGVDREDGLCEGMVLYMRSMYLLTRFLR